MKLNKLIIPILMIVFGIAGNIIFREAHSYEIILKIAETSNLFKE